MNNIKPFSGPSRNYQYNKSGTNNWLYNSDGYKQNVYDCKQQKGTPLPFDKYEIKNAATTGPSDPYWGS